MKSYKDYNLEALKRSDVLLASILLECGEESERYIIAKEYNTKLRITIHKKIPKGVENSMCIPRELDGKL